VISTNGDTHLGGDDFDQTLINHVADQFKKEQGIDLRKDTMALQRLQEACEKAKKELSSAQSTDINLPFITADATGPKHLQVTITRAQFEQMCDSLVERCRGPVVQALKDAKLDPKDIDEVVLVGGSTRIPKVQELVKKLFNKEPHKGVNPDEVVALGAAIQGGVLGGEVQDVLLLDVTPLSLGIETEGGLFTKLVERNTTVPTERKQVFSTAADSQTAVTVSVYQGERPMARDNRLLGQFNLEGIPPAPRGTPQIEVKFDIDANGILSVSAKDLGSNKEQTVKIEQSSGLNEAEIERMRKDAEVHAEEDKRKQRLAEARNRAEALCFQTEKLVKENSEKLSASDKAPLEAAITKAREAAKGEDVDAITSAHDSLEQAAHALSKVLYAATGGQGAGADAGSTAGQSAGGKGPDEVYFEEAKDAQVLGINAAKDHKVVVGNDNTHDVKHDRITKVENDEKLTVVGNRTTVVQKVDKTTVEQNQELVVQQNAKTTVYQKFTLSADTGVVIQCGDSKIELTPAGITLSNSSGAKVELMGPMVNLN
jgi:molecular chaperone DnaK